MNKGIKVAFAAFSIAALAAMTGCASTGDLKKLQAQVESIQATATSAAADAAAANAKADAAQACCNANSEKMDRMFKQSVNK
jgi:murein lipoprotein